jgi:hypothetical protein
MGMLVYFEGLAVPAGLGAFNDFGNFVSMRSDDGVIVCFGEIFCVEVQRIHKGRRIIYYHRLFVRDVTLRVAVDDLDAALAGFPLSKLPVGALSGSTWKPQLQQFKIVIALEF